MRGSAAFDIVQTSFSEVATCNLAKQTLPSLAYHCRGRVCLVVHPPEPLCGDHGAVVLVVVLLVVDDPAVATCKANSHLRKVTTATPFSGAFPSTVRTIVTILDGVRRTDSLLVSPHSIGGRLAAVTLPSFYAFVHRVPRINRTQE